MTKVSVILPVYNCEKFIGLTIESVLNQTFTDFEFIIINDGSSDKSLQIINKYAEKDLRIIVISQINKGFGESLNIGIQQSSCEMIIRIDHDDIMFPDRIKKQVEFMRNNDNIAVASCLAYYINENGKIIGKTYSDLKNINDSKRYLKENEAIGILHPGVIMRKSIIEKIGGYRGQFFPCEDIDLWNRLVEEGYNIVVMQNILMKYRISSVSEITSHFMNSRQKYNWVRQCMWNRRVGKTEISWDEYKCIVDNYSFITKLNKKRKDFAKFYYRTAGFDFAQDKYINFIFHIILSGILQPKYVFRRIIKQKL